MKLDISREEFDIIASALDYQIKNQNEKLEEMYTNLQFYSEVRESHLKESIEKARKVLNEKFDPIYEQENREYFESTEFILATQATEQWGLKDSTVRRAIRDGRIEKDECKKEGRDWKVTISAMKRLYGEPKQK